MADGVGVESSQHMITEKNRIVNFFYSTSIQKMGSAVRIRPQDQEKKEVKLTGVLGMDFLGAALRCSHSKAKGPPVTGGPFG
jgi:hypothetical protein